jgi:DNA-binding IscR family transcriptional regulator
MRREKENHATDEQSDLRPREALEGKITPVKCALCSKARKCASKSVWDKVKNSLSKTLYSIKLSDLVK